MDPANVELLCDFGFRCHCSGDSKLAEQYYRQALQVDPDHARTHNNLGVLLSQHQAIQPALEHFKMAGLSPTEAQHNLSLAQRPTR
jgi:Tfp pilus assembly protein PilF